MQVALDDMDTSPKIAISVLHPAILSDASSEKHELSVFCYLKASIMIMIAR